MWGGQRQLLALTLLFIYVMNSLIMPQFPNLCPAAALYVISVVCSCNYIL